MLFNKLFIQRLFKMKKEKINRNIYYNVFDLIFYRSIQYHELFFRLFSFFFSDKI